MVLPLVRRSRPLAAGLALSLGFHAAATAFVAGSALYAGNALAAGGRVGGRRATVKYAPAGRRNQASAFPSG